MHVRRCAGNTVSPVDYETALPGAEPRNFLEKIVWHKETEVESLQRQEALADLEEKARTAAPPLRDFVAALHGSKTRPALIAEVKKASPSKGVIREDFDPVLIAQAYQQGGAACLSVLTDEKFFQGSFSSLAAIREAVALPLLCKDFLLHRYQLYLARLHGADAVLLIAAVLSNEDLQEFLTLARELGMVALVEVHTLNELDRVLALDGVTLVGINNRNLEDFSVDLQTTCKILSARGGQLCSRNILVVSESGLCTADDLRVVAEAGARAVLMGESLVRQADPKHAVAQLLSQLV